MTEVTLRELAKEFAAGSIEENVYRQERATLIKGILSGEIPLQENVYPPLIMPQDEDTLDITERREQKTKPPSEQPEPAPASSPQPAHKWIIGAAIAIIVIAAVIILIFSGGDTPEPRTGISAGPEQPAPEVTIDDLVPSPATATAGQQLIREFLSANSWDSTSLDRLVQNWQSLTEEERTAAGSSTEITQIANAIHRQLLEESALAGLDTTADTLTKQYILVAAADSLGIEDSRIAVIEPAAVVQAETPDEPPSAQVEAPQPAPETTAAIPSPVSADTGMTAAKPETVIATRPATVVPRPGSRETPATAAQVVETAATAAVPETELAVTVPAPEPDAAPATEPVATPEPQQNQTTGTPAVAAATRRSAEAACNTSLLNSRRPYCRDELDGIGNGPTMVVIRSGKYLMGGTLDSEKPVHEVNISYPFAMSVHEITYGEYERYCTDTGVQCPAQPWAGRDYPVVNITWKEAVAYTEWLTMKTGRKYRLPSESEWEYAARAGTTSAYPFGDDVDITSAIFSYQKQLTSPLPKTDRSINRNKFRLYHIVGNVREWVADGWHADYSGAPADGSARPDGAISAKVVRGGSYSDDARELRSASRTSLPADSADSYTGFRVIQEI